VDFKFEPPLRSPCRHWSSSLLIVPLRGLLAESAMASVSCLSWLGRSKAMRFALALAGIDTPRPMSLSLMYRVLGMANIAIERVVVTALRDNIFYAVLTMRIGGQLQEVDARPSDAITLALYAGAPVFVTSETLDLCGQRTRRSSREGNTARAIRGSRRDIRRKTRRRSGEASARCPTRERPLVLRRTLGKLLQTELV